MDNEKVVSLVQDDLPMEVKESINILRGSIQLNESNLKIIAITSSLPNEGKSVVAFNLAKSLANLNKKVLYFDTDIRNSTVKSTYKINTSVVGLSEFLTNQNHADEIIYNTNDKFLDIIFSGARVPNPSELVSKIELQKLMEYLKEKYDYIIVDTPPINLIIDGILISKLCDTTILVIESGVTDKNCVNYARKKLESANINILGVVLNKVGSKDYGYGYGHGYGYGYGHGYGYGYGYGDTTSKKKKSWKRK